MNPKRYNVPKMIPFFKTRMVTCATLDIYLDIPFPNFQHFYTCFLAILLG